MKGTKVNHPDKLLLPKEIKAILLALATVIEDCEAGLKNAEKFRFNKEAIASTKDMLESAQSAKKKMEQLTLGGKTYGPLEDYKRGDEREFQEPPTDSGTERLKRVMEDLKAIFQEDDIAAMVVLHTPGYSEFLNWFSPSYSVLSMTADGAYRMQAKAAELKGGADERNYKVNSTLNMVQHFAETGGRVAFEWLQLWDEFKKNFEFIPDADPETEKPPSDAIVE